MKDYHIVYEDNHLLIVNKRAGILVQGDSTGDVTLTDVLKDYIKEKYQKPGAVFLHPVHRLDRPVSGLVIFARTSKALERMMEMFRKRDIQKTYWAVVHNHAESEESVELVNWILKDSAKNMVHCYNKARGAAKRAELSYKQIGASKGFSLFEVKPKTGRPHQIRAQMSYAGFPIAGDVKYGAKGFLSDQSIALHAYSLEFDHPISKEKVIIKCLPEKKNKWSLFD